MALIKEQPYMEGYLLMPPQGLKKKWQKKYGLLFTYSNWGNERLEIYDSEDDAAKHSALKVIPLDDCLKISSEPQKHQPNAFSIVTKHSTHHFACSSCKDTQDWMTACQCVAFRDTFSTITVEEDNDLYCPSGDAGVYRVALITTEASQRCRLLPCEYTLVVAPEQLELRDPDTQNLLFTWPYRFIRRYSYKKGRFSFEAGRKCASGEGSFDMEHPNSQEIFQCTTTKMNNMKQKLGSGNHHSFDSELRTSIRRESSPMEVDEGLAAALTMSARSRSPLVSTTFSTPQLPSVAPSIPPVKPPRKNPPVPIASPHRYDQVEVRTDAWRTLGTDHYPHSERPHVPHPSAPSSSSSCSSVATTPTTAATTTPPAAFFTSPPEYHSDYDKLDHFGSTPKLDEDPSYSTIFRNDATAGYGVIRKVSSPRHEVCNDLEYALVFKALPTSHKV